MLPMFHDSAELEISKYGINLMNQPKHIRCKRKFVKLAMKDDPIYFQYATKSLRYQKDFAEYALKMDPRNYEFVKRNRVTFEQLKNVLSRDGTMMEFVPPDLKHNRDLTEIAVRNNPSSIQFSCYRNKNYMKYLYHKYIDNLDIFRCCYPYVTKKEDIIKGLKIHPREYSQDYFRSKHWVTYDYDIAVTAVEGCASNYSWLNNMYKKDKRFIRIVLNKDPTKWTLIDRDILFSNKEFAIIFLKNSPSYSRAYNELTNYLKEDKDIVRIAMEKSVANYLDIPKKFRKKYEYVTMFLNSYPREYERIPKMFKKDREIAEIVVRKYPSVFGELNSEFRDNDDIAKIAIDLYPKNYEHLSERLKKNKYFYEKAVVTGFLKLKDSPFSIKNDRDMIIFNLKERRPFDFQNIKMELKDDLEIGKLAVRASLSNFQHLSERLRSSTEFIEYVSSFCFDEEAFNRHIKQWIV